jgi:hypothetical protein
MKGFQGLVLAIGFGIVAALCNYFYLASKLPEAEMVGFVGIKEDADVSRGDVLRDAHLVRVDVPQRHVGNLMDFAVPYTSYASAVGSPVWRDLQGGSLLLRDDFTTPRADLNLGPREALVWIPVNTQAMVPSLIEPGDLVSFLVSRSRFAPTMPSENGMLPNPGMAPAVSGPTETIGPFKILSLGSRLGSSEVFQSARRPTRQENVVGILVELDEGGNPIPLAQKLIDLLDATNNRPVGVMLLGRAEREN